MVKKNNIFSNNNSVVRKKYINNLPNTSQTPTNQSLNANSLLLNKSIENKRSTSNSRSKDKPLRMKDNTVSGHYAQTPTNSAIARYPQQTKKNNTGQKVENVNSNVTNKKQNNVQTALQNMMHRK